MNRTLKNIPECIFCRIAAGQAPAAKIVETPRVLAFLDIAPVHYGHTLVIPKDHHENLLDLPDDLWLENGPGVQAGGQGPGPGFFRPGVQCHHDNFDAAGQVVFHAHLHVIPRFLSDGLHLFPQGSYRPGDMERVGQQLRSAIEQA